MEPKLKPSTYQELKERALEIPHYGIDVFQRYYIDGTPCGEKCGYFPHREANWYAIKNFVVVWGDGKSEYVYPVYKGIKDILESAEFQLVSSKEFYNPFFCGAVPEEAYLNDRWKQIRKEITT